MANHDGESGVNSVEENSLDFSPQFPFTKTLTFKFFLTGVLLPVGCLVCGWLGVNVSFDLPWQTGLFRHYVAMFLQGESLAPLFPFFFYSLTSMCATLFIPKARKFYWVQVGLVTGVVLSLVYLVAVVITSQYLAFVAAAVAGAAISLCLFLLELFYSKFHRFGIAHLMLFTAVVCVLLALFQLTGSNPRFFVLIPLGVLITAGPVLCSVTYLRVAVSSLREFRAVERSRKFFDIPLALGWLVSVVFAWRLSIDLLLINYQNLPTSDPNCYVASAAANGHGRIVGAQKVRLGDKTVVVNLQMQRLKFLEFVVMATVPKLHSRIREAYNRFGPRLATVCRRSKLAADLTFVLLKPFEWLAILIGIVARISNSQVQSIYVRDN